MKDPLKIRIYNASDEPKPHNNTYHKWIVAKNIWRPRSMSHRWCTDASNITKSVTDSRKLHFISSNKTSTAHKYHLNGWHIIECQGPYFAAVCFIIHCFHPLHQKVEDLARAIWWFLSQNWKLASRKNKIYVCKTKSLYIFLEAQFWKWTVSALISNLPVSQKSNILGQRPTQTSVWATIKVLLLYFSVGHRHVVCSYRAHTGGIAALLILSFLFSFLSCPFLPSSVQCVY